MKLRSEHIILKTIITLIFMLFIMLITINLLYNSIKLTNEEYLKLLLDDSYNNSFYSDIINICTDINPTTFILKSEKRVVKSPNIITSKPTIYLYSINNEYYQNEFNFKPDTTLVAYLISNKVNGIYENTNINDFAKLNNIDIDTAILNLINEKKNLYDSLQYFIDIEIGDYNNKISIYTDEDNFIFANNLRNNINKNKNICNIYFSDKLKIEIGSRGDSISDIMPYINLLASSLNNL